MRFATYGPLAFCLLVVPFLLTGCRLAGEDMQGPCPTCYVYVEVDGEPWTYSQADTRLVVNYNPRVDQVMVRMTRETPAGERYEMSFSARPNELEAGQVPIVYHAVYTLYTEGMVFTEYKWPEEIYNVFTVPEEREDSWMRIDRYAQHTRMFEGRFEATMVRIRGTTEGSAFADTVRMTNGRFRLIPRRY